MAKGKRLQRLRAFMMDYAYLVTLGAILAVIAASALYTQRLRQETAPGLQAAAQAPEVLSSPSPTPAPVVTAMPTIAPLRVRAMQLSGTPVWPLEGEVIRPYDALETVYWEALGCWRTHQALDIAGEAGQAVRCAAAGKVAGVSRDELWGWQISIVQQDGRTAGYAGLASCDVSRGEEVDCGQVIGTLLARIPCEGELGAHLHLTLERDGRPQDPQGMLPER